MIVYNLLIEKCEEILNRQDDIFSFHSIRYGLKMVFICVTHHILIGRLHIKPNTILKVCSSRCQTFFEIYVRIWKCQLVHQRMHVKSQFWLTVQPSMNANTVDKVMACNSVMHQFSTYSCIMCGPAYMTVKTCRAPITEILVWTNGDRSIGQLDIE